MIHVVIKRKRGLLGRQPVDPVILRLGCDFIVIGGEWLATKRAQAPFTAVLLVSALDLVVNRVWKEISFGTFR